MPYLLTVYRIRLAGGDTPAVRISDKHVLWCPPSDGGKARIDLFTDLKPLQVIAKLVPVSVDYSGRQHNISFGPGFLLRLNAELVSILHGRTGGMNAVCRILRAFDRAPAEWSLKGMFEDYDRTQWVMIEGDE